jgi:hypothetical protein
LNANLIDPLARGTKWLFASFPASKPADFGGFPIVTIGSPEVGYENASVGKAQLRMYPILIPITPFTTKLQQLDEIIDQITNTLVTKQYTLEAAGLRNMSITPQNTRTSYSEIGKIHEKTLNVSLELWTT